MRDSEGILVCRLVDAKICKDHLHTPPALARATRRSFLPNHWRKQKRSTRIRAAMSPRRLHSRTGFLPRSSLRLGGVTEEKAILELANWIHPALRRRGREV